MGLMRHSPEMEKNTIEAMTRLYCRYLHKSAELCKNCRSVLEYGFKRIDHCTFGPEKPACNDCKVHCFSAEMREEVKKIMRYSGPKMIYMHPVMALYHFLK